MILSEVLIYISICVCVFFIYTLIHTYMYMYKHIYTDIHMQMSKAGRQPGSPSWEFPWLPALAGTYHTLFLCHRAASTLSFSCTQSVHVEKLSLGHRTEWVCLDNQWSIVISIIRLPLRPQKLSTILALCFVLLPWCTAGVTPEWKCIIFLIWL